MDRVNQFCGSNAFICQDSFLGITSFKHDTFARAIGQRAQIPFEVHACS